MRTYKNSSGGFTSSNNVWIPVSVPDYNEDVSYDANGNILKYRRYGNSTNTGLTNAKIMDSLSYKYLPNTNKLSWIKDSVPSGNYTVDVDNQNSGNYAYDAIGNLTKDSTGGIDSISWNVYGKIQKINKHNGTVINYYYDAGGNRIGKVVTGASTGNGETWYVHDASGNVMSVYTVNDNTVNSGALTLSEQGIYGSSRLGLYKPNLNLAAYTQPTLVYMNSLGSVGYNSSFIRGKKFFELTNHLGNVLVTLSDKKIGIDGSDNDGVVDFFNADIVSANDYYPFGMEMPGRDTTFKTGYRYGFNGKEMDNETYGQGNEYDYGMRIYNPRVGRFFSVDPLSSSFPWYSPYQYAGNTPIQAIDLDGNEEYHITFLLDKQGKTQIQINQPQFYEEHSLLFWRWKSKLPESYVVSYNGQNYYIGFAGPKGAANNGMQPLFKELVQNPKFDARVIPNLFYNEEESSKFFYTHQVDQLKEATLNYLATGVLTGYVELPDGKLRMLGSNGTQLPSKTLWQEKNSTARIDVENPAPGQRPGTLHYQDEDNVKYQYNVNDNKFYGYNKTTQAFDKEAPKSVNKLLENKDIQKAIDKGLKYLGEEPKFNETTSN